MSIYIWERVNKVFFYYQLNIFGDLITYINLVLEVVAFILLISYYLVIVDYMFGVRLILGWGVWWELAGGVELIGGGRITVWGICWLWWICYFWMWHLTGIHLNNSIRSIIACGLARILTHFGSICQWIRVRTGHTHLVLWWWLISWLVWSFQHLQDEDWYWELKEEHNNWCVWAME